MALQEYWISLLYTIGTNVIDMYNGLILDHKANRQFLYGHVLEEEEHKASIQN